MRQNPLEAQDDHGEEDKQMYCAIHRNGAHNTEDCRKWGELGVEERRTKCKLFVLQMFICCATNVLESTYEYNARVIRIVEFVET